MAYRARTYFVSFMRYLLARRFDYILSAKRFLSTNGISIAVTARCQGLYSLCYGIPLLHSLHSLGIFGQTRNKHGGLQDGVARHSCANNFVVVVLFRHALNARSICSILSPIHQPAYIGLC